MRDGLKRAFDIGVAGFGLVVTAPLLAVLAAAVRIDSPGPSLFSQTRVGLHRRPIRTLKLRTMVVDADRRGPGVTADRDPRITRVGRWLRKTKLDELPQLWNVLVGDMSIVGPRPEVPQYVASYRPEWDEVFTVRPGLTDAASIAFRAEESLLALARDRERAYREVVLPLKLALAIQNVRESSLPNDVLVIARTMLAIARGPDVDHAGVLAEARRRIEQLNEES